MSDWDNFDTLAVEAEAGDPYRFTWNGQSFEIPTLAQLDWQVHRAVIDEGDPTEKVRMLLGDQFDAFTAKPMSKARLDELVDRWLRHQGVSLGESSASEGS